MASVAVLSAKLIASADQFSSEMNKAGKVLQSFEARAAATAGAVKSAFVGMGLSFAANFGISKSLESFEADEMAGARLGAVLKATGSAAGLTADQIQSLASDLQRVTVFADELTVSAAAVLLTFKEVKGDVFIEAMKAAQDLSTVLGTDLQGSVLQIGKALQSPVEGLTALKRAGVSFNEEQKNTIKSMVEAGDLLGAQKVILRELNSEFGGAATAAAATYSGSLKVLKNQLGEISESIGKELIPAVIDLNKVLLTVGESLKSSTPSGGSGSWNSWKMALGAMLGINMQEALYGGAQAPPAAGPKASDFQLVGPPAPLPTSPAALESIEKLTAALQKQVATYGMSAGAIKAWEVAMMAGTEAEKAQATALANQLSVMDEWKDFAAKVFQQTRTPFELHEQQIMDLTNALMQGKLSWDTYTRAVEQANVALEKTNEKENLKLSPGALKGSQEAIKIIQQQQASGRDGRNPNKALEDIGKNHLAEAKRNGSDLKQIVASIQAGGLVRLARP